MQECKLENLNFQDQNENPKFKKLLLNIKLKLFNVQYLGLKYYRSSLSYEIISIPILLFQLLSYSFYETVQLFY